MDIEIKSFLNNYLNTDTVSPEMLAPLLNYVSVINKPKGEILIRQGYQHSYSYFIVKGLARVFYLKNGAEINFWFGLENEPLGSIDTLKGKASKVNVELLEPCTLIRFNIRSLQNELKDDPTTIFLLKIIMEEYVEFLEERLFGLQGLSTIERYNHLLKTEPDIFQRISLTHIASYIGMSRETLSRLRNKRAL